MNGDPAALNGGRWVATPGHTAAALGVVPCTLFLALTFGEATYLLWALIFFIELMG